MISIVVALVALAVAVLGLFYVRSKFRLLWARQEDNDKRFRQQQQALVALKKSQILQGMPDLRLPAIMPSQHGEDIVLAQFFEFKRDGFFIEVGAFHGVELSNSYFFEALGWDGCLFEPNPQYCASYQKLRPFSQHVNAAVLSGTEATAQLTTVAGEPALSYSRTSQGHRARVAALETDTNIIEVPRTGLSETLGDSSRPIDFISIDVEGAEMDVLATIDFDRHRPTVFVIEDNSQGADKSVRSFLQDHNYRLCYTLGCNDFYLAKDDPREISLQF